MDGWPQPGLALWSIAFWAFGFLCGLLADEWRWRRRRRIKAADRTDAGRRDARRQAAAPLLGLLADTMATIERLGPGARPGGVLRPKDKDIAAGLAALAPHLAPGDLERLRALAQACQGDEACKDREAALARLRELRDSIHGLAVGH